jgi:hypothetical protein
VEAAEEEAEFADEADGLLGVERMGIPMIDATRHVPLRAIAWEPGAVRLAIDEIVADAISAFDTRLFWPAHPLDDGTVDRLCLAGPLA